MKSYFRNTIHLIFNITHTHTNPLLVVLLFFFPQMQFFPPLQFCLIYLIFSYLLSNKQVRSVVELMPMIGARYYSQLDTVQYHNDILHSELAKEMENGRLCRLMVKLATINERPEWVNLKNKKIKFMVNRGVRVFIYIFFFKVI